MGQVGKVFVEVVGPEQRLFLLQIPWERLHENLIKWPTQYGKISKYFLGRNAHIVCSDPQLLYQVAVKQFTSFHDRYLSFTEL